MLMLKNNRLLYSNLGKPVLVPELVLASYDYLHLKL